MKTQLEQLCAAFLKEAEAAKHALMARADALNAPVDLPDFSIAGDESEFIFANVELQGTRCKVGIDRTTSSIVSLQLELILEGKTPLHVTLDMEEAVPERILSVRAGEWLFGAVERNYAVD